LTKSPSSDSKRTSLSPKDSGGLELGLDVGEGLLPDLLEGVEIDEFSLHLYSWFFFGGCLEPELLNYVCFYARFSPDRFPQCARQRVVMLNIREFVGLAS